MSSFTGNGSQRIPSSAASFDSYQFDFGFAGASSRSSASRPLRDQKPNPASAASVPSVTTSSKPSPAATWSHQPSSKPTWTHQPAAGVGAARSGNLSSAPASLVGDIFGKSWTSAAPTSSGLGIPKSDPTLFGDLVGSALGQGRGAGGNVHLKHAAPAPKSTFSMGNLSESLPKFTATAATATTSTASNIPLKQSSWGIPMGGGGQPMKSATTGAQSMNSKKDPFGSLTDLGSKPSKKAPMSSNSTNRSGTGGVGGNDFSFGAFQNPSSTKANNVGTQAQSFFASTPSQQQPVPAKTSADPMDMLFSSSAAAAPPAGAASAASGSHTLSEMNDWDLGADFAAHDSSGPTTELEGLPPPPAGITASAAKTKGMDNYKQGQFADAIKWLSWALLLLEKPGNSTSEALTCRASCYKEVGEYKKAVADCTKVLEQDSSNVEVLVQRALLYESMEKYKLGAEDLRMVMKIDPGNRLARSSIHRLNKFAD